MTTAEIVNRKISCWDCIKYKMKHQMPIKTFVAVGSIFRTFIYTPTRRFYDKVIQKKDHILNFKNLVSALKTCSVGVGSILRSPAWSMGIVLGAAIDSDFKSRFLELLSSKQGYIFCTLFLWPIAVKGILLAYKYGHNTSKRISSIVEYRDVPEKVPVIAEDRGNSLDMISSSSEFNKILEKDLGIEDDENIPEENPVIKGDIENSRVVFLPDLHDDEKLQSKRKTWLFDCGNMHEGDVFLLEGESFDEQEFRTDRDAHSYITINGWEDKDLYESSKKKYFQVIHLRDELKDNNLDPDIRLRLRRECAGLDKEILIGLETRNDAMVKNINFVLSKLDPKNRVFVLAGELHINKRLLDQFSSYATVSFPS